MAWLRLFSHGIHRIHRSFVALIRPRNSQNSQKLGCVSPPTDFTDLHRWLGCVGPPTEFTEFTEVWGCCWLRGYGRCHTLLICAHPCASVRICGRLFSARNFCAFRGFCGNIVSHGLHRFAQMAWLRLFFHGIHGIHRSFGVLLAAWVRQDAIPSYICVNPCYLWETLLCKKLLCVPWEYSLPRISQINTDGWLRLFSHGIHRIHRSLGCCWLRGYGRMPYPPTSV